MVLMKRSQGEELSMIDACFELTESELSAICGGAEGSFSLPDWFASPHNSHEAKSPKHHASKNKATADAVAAAQAKALADQFMQSLGFLTAVTGGLVGTII